MDMHKHKLNLSDGQKTKLRIAFKKRRSAIIGLTSDQITSGKDSILFTDEQHKDILKARKNQKGLRLNISYDQLLKSKEGGLLNEILEFIENSVPLAKYATPVVRNKVAPAIKEYIVPWLKDWINKELDNVIKKGSGLDQNTVHQIRNHLTSAAIKKNLNH